MTRAGYYAWQHRRPSTRAQADTDLQQCIARVHRDSRGTYGSPRVHRVLRANGQCVGENRVARIMRAQGIKARVATIRYTCPNLQRFYGRIPNRQLEVAITYPDQVWVGDITYLKVGALWRYLAVVMDKCSRRIVGWSFGRNKDVQLTLRALNRAVYNRRPRAGLIFHTDRGIEYAAGAFTQRLAQLGNRFHQDAEVAGVLRSYLPFYNRDRLHSSLNYVSPAAYEQRLA